MKVIMGLGFVSDFWHMSGKDFSELVGASSLIH